jgi:hypothetical protein
VLGAFRGRSGGVHGVQGGRSWVLGGAFVGVGGVQGGVHGGAFVGAGGKGGWA